MEATLGKLTPWEMLRTKWGTRFLKQRNQRSTELKSIQVRPKTKLSTEATGDDRVWAVYYCNVVKVNHAL